MSMEKLKKCRICLVENVRMYVVGNKNLQEIYEKLTDVPFLTEDRRPTLVCFFCCAKLKQCHQLQRKCLEAEKLFAQILNDDYETKLLINQDQDPLAFSSELNITPTMHISVVDECQTENIAIKEELPAVCEGLDDNIEPKEEHQSDELELENLDNSCLDVADITPNHSELDLEDDEPLMKLKIEVEEDQEVSENNQRARETKRATVAKKPKLETRGTKLEGAIITAEQTKKENSDSKIIWRTQKRTSQPDPYIIKPYICDRGSFNRVQKMIQYSRSKIGENPYKCDVCQSCFSKECDLIKHKRIHTGEKPYKCDVCQRSFSKKSVLHKHILVHTGEKPFKCILCERSFRHLCNLKRHILIHTGEKPYKCDICPRSFNERGPLAHHIRIHTGENNPYECDVCQRGFNQKSHLAIHRRRHTGEKPYKCDLCPLSFSQKGHLTIHKRIHTGEKPHECDVCNRNFTKKSDLTKHYRIHTGEKPFKCDICQCGFRQNVHLTKHLRIHHNVEKSFQLDIQGGRNIDVQ